MRPEYVVDHSPGWEWFLGVLHRAFGWDEDALISFSVASMAICVFCFPLIWVRHPEAWLAAVLAQMIAIPQLMERWTQGRPYLLTEGILMALLFPGPKKRPPPPWWKSWPDVFRIRAFGVDARLVVSVGAALRGLFPGPTLAGRPLAGGLLGRREPSLGALLTGRPLAFLYGAIFMAKCIYEEHAPKWLLVGNFNPAAANSSPSPCWPSFIFGGSGKPNPPRRLPPSRWSG
jgi:hypothetical protein